MHVKVQEQELMGRTNTSVIVGNKFTADGRNKKIQEIWLTFLLTGSGIFILIKDSLVCSVH